MKTTLCLALGALALARAPRYNDDTYGFSIEAPKFAKGAQGTSVIPVMFLGPAEHGFSPNLNVMVQNTDMTLEAYREMSQAQLKQAGLKVNSERNLKVSGRDATVWEYEGNQRGKELRFLALAVAEKGSVILVTCTALKDGFEKYEKEFLASIKSFRLAD